MELPKSFQYVDIGENTYRANFKSPEDVNKWIAEYSQNSCSKWLTYFQNSKSKRYIFRKVLYCRHSRLWKKPQGLVRGISRNTGCTAKIHLFIKLTTSCTKRKDKHVAKGYPGIIKFENSHNHPKLLHQDLAKIRFLEYFNQGMTVPEAIQAYKSEPNMIENSDVGTKKFCPKYTLIYCWYQRWKSSKIKSEPFLQRMFSKTSSKSNGIKDLIKLFANKIKTVGISEELGTVLYNSISKVSTPDDWTKVVKKPPFCRKPKLPVNNNIEENIQKNKININSEETVAPAPSFIFLEVDEDDLQSNVFESFIPIKTKSSTPKSKKLIPTYLTNNNATSSNGNLFKPYKNTITRNLPLVEKSSETVLSENTPQFSIQILDPSNFKIASIDQENIVSELTSLPELSENIQILNENKLLAENSNRGTASIENPVVTLNENDVSFDQNLGLPTETTDLKVTEILNSKDQNPPKHASKHSKSTTNSLNIFRKNSINTTTQNSVEGRLITPIDHNSSDALHIKLDTDNHNSTTSSTYKPLIFKAIKNQEMSVKKLNNIPVTKQIIPSKYPIVSPILKKNILFHTQSSVRPKNILNGKRVVTRDGKEAIVLTDFNGKGIINTPKKKMFTLKKSDVAKLNNKISSTSNSKKFSFIKKSVRSTNTEDSNDSDDCNLDIIMES